MHNYVWPHVYLHVMYSMYVCVHKHSSICTSEHSELSMQLKTDIFIHVFEGQDELVAILTKSLKK